MGAAGIRDGVEHGDEAPAAAPEELDSEDVTQGAATARLAPEVEEALAAADQPTGDEFEDRWAELMNRVQAVGVGEADGEASGSPSRRWPLRPSQS